MPSERIVLIAQIDTVLFAEPTIEARVIADGELRDVAQLLVEASASLPGQEVTLEDAVSIVAGLAGGANGEPRRDAWLGVWQGPGLPVSAILCTTWRGMPFITHVATAAAVRERGYASSLVRSAATVFEASGATHVGISLDRQSPAMHLFRELGFVEMFSTVDA